MGDLWEWPRMVLEYSACVSLLPFFAFSVGFREQKSHYKQPPSLLSNTSNSTFLLFQE